MKLSVDSRCCSALNIPVVWQWRWWWWWWAKSNWLSLSLSLNSPSAGFTPPHDSQGPRQPIRTVKPPPPSPPPPGLNANRGSCGRILAGNQQTSGFYRTVRQNLPERSIQSVSFICLSVWSTTLPRLHSQRLQWEITFLVNLIFFLSGLTFH